MFKKSKNRGRGCHCLDVFLQSDLYDTYTKALLCDSILVKCAADLLHFKVQDAGCGIPRDKFDHLFKAFTQVDPSTTRQFGGTGLGLVICSRLIQRMGGRVWVESAVGVGSCFQFVLPLLSAEQISEGQSPCLTHTEETEADRSLLENDFARQHPLRLLVCEDDEDNRWVMRELLEILGYQPDVAQDGDEAVEIMQRGI